MSLWVIVLWVGLVVVCASFIFKFAKMSWFDYNKLKEQAQAMAATVQNQAAETAKQYQALTSRQDESEARQK